MNQSSAKFRKHVGKRQGNDNNPQPSSKEGLIPILTKTFGPLHPNPAIWANGLNVQQGAEWLVDCYRLRVTDDYEYGCFVRGSNVSKHSKQDVIEDFLIFCKLAAKRAVLPPQWHWDAFISAAASQIDGRFTLKDAERKYGRENAFLAFMGDRSLRVTAELVYGFGCAAAKDRHRQQLGQLLKTVDGRFYDLLQDNEAYFDDVGGITLWETLDRKYSKFAWLFGQLYVGLACVAVCVVACLVTLMMMPAKPR